MHNWKEIFANIDTLDTQRAIGFLSNNGILTDEDMPFVSKIGYKQGGEEFKNHLKENGFTEPLNIVCKFIPSNGEVCAIYNAEKFTNLEAINYIEKNYSGNE